MSQLALRVISAVVAALGLIAVYYYYELPGLVVISCAVSLLAQVEFNRMAFRPLNAPYSLRAGFSLVCGILLLVTAIGRGFILETWGALTAVYLSTSLWLLRDRFNNERILALLATSGLGLVYLGFFPAFAIKTLLLEPQGPAAFATLLLIVFAGDTLAYFGGSWFGRRKIMEAVSPKKTWAGALAGALGSVLAAAACSMTIYSEMPTWYLSVIALGVAFVAQSGDLFISLVKRVAQVKDSGHIMPGHGGFLDRLDGLFFAAPFFYASVRWGYSLF